MLTNYQMTGENPQAKIAINKNVIKHFERKVYLNDGQEFQLELFNPTSRTILAKIWINKLLISVAGIVIKPGQRLWLERFIDTNAKFKFNTYFVDGSLQAKQAIQNNGKIEVQFFNEKERKPNFSIYSYDYKYDYPRGNEYLGYDTRITCSSSTNAVYTTSTTKATMDSIETGRVEKGNVSDQSFTNFYGDFEWFAFYTEYLQILPLSQKEYLSKKDLQRKCQSCGKRIKNDQDTFCSRCGNKL